MNNALTIDVEDYQNIFARDRLGVDGPPTPAVVRNTQRIIGWLAPRGIRATFFVLGEVAQRYPDLIREIDAGGHELGVHGFYHRQVFKLTPATFREEVASAKKLIEDIIGKSVDGHRAPAFSIGPATRWALDVLVDVGFRYDSSIFPISGRRYGWPGFPLDIHEMQLGDGRTIIEAPLSTVTILGKRLPACGGGYLRLFPGAYTRWAMRRIHQKRPAILYMHPYEIEMNPPEPDLSRLDPGAVRRITRFHSLQLRNRGTVEPKILRLLDEFLFVPLRDVINRTLRSPALTHS